jgi:hypothetical protein
MTALVARFSCSLFSTRERTELSGAEHIPRQQQRIRHGRKRHIQDNQGFGAPVGIVIGDHRALARVPDMFLLYRRCETSRSSTRKVNHPAERRQLYQNIFHHHSVIVNGTA